MVDTIFTEMIERNLAYWLGVTSDLTDAKLAELDRERWNLLQAIELGWQIAGLQPLVNELVVNLFPLAERCGYLADWQAWITRASEITADPILQLKLRNQLGFAQHMLHDYEAAVASHSYVATMATTLACDAELAEACFQLSNNYWALGRLDQAEYFGLQALSLFERLPGPLERKRAAVSNTLGLAADARGEPARAAELFARAAGLWGQAGDASYQARSLINLSRAQRALGSAAAALACLDQAEALLAPTPNELDRARVHLSRGVVYFEMQAWAAAESAFRQANSSIVQQQAGLDLRAFIHHNLGSVLLSQGRLDEAEPLLRAGAAMWGQLGEPARQANSLDSLGELAAARGDWLAARDLFAQALALLASADQAWTRRLQAEVEAHRAAAAARCRL